MLYMGGKGRLGPTIASVILSNTVNRGDYYEPFFGGGNSFKHVAPHFANTFVGDAHEDLMLMWQAAKDGWIPPEAISEDEYKMLRKADPSALRGFAGFGCSFGGKWFGGYARSKQNGDGYYARHAHNETIKIGKLLQSATVKRCSYSEWAPSPKSIVYADPPYKNTTKYSAKFDHDNFWKTMKQWAIDGVDVFVSEYSAPQEWKSIFSKEQRRKVSGGTGEQTMEHVFVLRATHLKIVTSQNKSC